jgi:hypothetical protein
MADKKTQAQKRLLKKLSALRKTLRKDEREALDRFILGASGEVRAHGYDSSAQPIIAFTQNAYTVVEDEVADVGAHSMTAPTAQIESVTTFTKDM